MNSQSSPVDRWNLHARALGDYFAGERGATIITSSDYETDRLVPVGEFFREPDGLTDIDETAVGLCRGRVLDVGAGTGSITLELQDVGLEVDAIDFLPQAVEIMRARGVKLARCVDFFDLDSKPYDTMLLLMNGIGFVETLEGLNRFLAKAKALLAPGGQILLDSLDLRDNFTPEQRAMLAAPRALERYYGEVSYRFRYRGELGGPVGWLFVDEATLGEAAGRAGLATQVVYQESGGAYLARLVRV